MATPHFAFTPPRGYFWLLEREIIGFDSPTRLRPWYFLAEPWDVQKTWPQGPSKDSLVAFARRQDNDDIACLEVVGGKAVRVVLIHGWTSEGYVVCESYENFWEWIKGVIDDIAQEPEP